MDNIRKYVQRRDDSFGGRVTRGVGESICHFRSSVLSSQYCLRKLWRGWRKVSWWLENGRSRVASWGEMSKGSPGVLGQPTGARGQDQHDLPLNGARLSCWKSRISLARRGIACQGTNLEGGHLWNLKESRIRFSILWKHRPALSSGLRKSRFLKLKWFLNLIMNQSFLTSINVWSIKLCECRMSWSIWSMRGTLDCERH